MNMDWFILTPAGQEHLDGNILQQVSPGEYRSDLAEVPFAVQVLAVFQHLEKGKRTLIKQSMAFEFLGNKVKGDKLGNN